MQYQNRAGSRAAKAQTGTMERSFMESSSDCATELDLPAPGAERPLTDWLCATALPPASPTRMPEQRFEYLDLPLAAALRRRARRLQSRPIRLPGPARTA